MVVFVPEPFHPARPYLVAPVPLDPAGRAGPTKGQAQGRLWRRSSRGFYVPVDACVELPEQRIVEAAVRLPDYGGVTGWAALHWWGARWFEGWDITGRTLRPVALATGGITISRGQGVEVSEEGLDPSDLTRHDGLRLTTALRSACFEMRYAPSDRHAVVALSMAAYSDLVSVEEMALYAAAHSGWTGIPRCRRALSLAVENAWSPTEVTMLLIWQLDAGRPRPLCNRPVFDRTGRLIGTPDLIDPVAGVVGEYEGVVHLAGKQRAVDVTRESAFRRVGLEPVVMTAADLRDHAGFVRRLDDAYARARHQAESTRMWTITSPHWWIPTLTVAQRRALTPEERMRLLGHRRAA